MSIKPHLLTVCAGTVLICVIASVASADLAITFQDFETAHPSRTLTAADLNKPISLSVWVTVNGVPGNRADESLQFIEGSVVGHGPIKGTIAPAFYYTNPTTGALVGPLTGWGDPYEDKYSFSGSGSQNGLQQNIGGSPGAIDLGGKPGDPTENWIIFRSDRPVPTWHGKAVWDIAWGNIWALAGLITYTPTELAPGVTEITFELRQDQTGAILPEAASWSEDGTAPENMRNASTGVIQSTPFVISFPDPAIPSLLALGATILLPRRSRK